MNHSPTLLERMAKPDVTTADCEEAFGWVEDCDRWWGFNADTRTPGLHQLWHAARKKLDRLCFGR